ncbi:hypothetical protein PMAYCL1PPCAC_16221, partial [Pristionchus mayeri]
TLTSRQQSSNLLQSTFSGFLCQVNQSTRKKIDQEIEEVFDATLRILRVPIPSTIIIPSKPSAAVVKRRIPPN